MSQSDPDDFTCECLRGIGGKDCHGKMSYSSDYFTDVLFVCLFVYLLLRLSKKDISVQIF